MSYPQDTYEIDPLPPRRPLNRKGRLMRTAAGVTTLFAAGGLVANAKISQAEDSKTAKPLPACIVPVKPLDGPDKLLGRFNRRGADVDRDNLTVFAYDDGRLRTPENTPDFDRYESMGMQAGDKAKVTNISWRICEKVGGTVVDIAATGHLDPRPTS